MTDEQLKYLDQFIKYTLPTLSGIISIIAFFYAHSKAKKMETFKSQIDKSRFEHNTAYQQIFKVRVKMIKTKNFQIRHVIDLFELAKISKDKGEIKKCVDEIRQILIEMVVYFEDEKLYIEKGLANLFDKSFSSLSTFIRAYLYHSNIDDYLEESKQFVLGRDVKSIENEVSEILELIKETFEYQSRRILGVETGESYEDYPVLKKALSKNITPSPFSSLFAIFSLKYRR